METTDVEAGSGSGYSDVGKAGFGIADGTRNGPSHGPPLASLPEGGDELRCTAEHRVGDGESGSEHQGRDTFGVPGRGPDRHGAAQRFADHDESFMPVLDGRGRKCVDEEVEVERRVREGRTAHARVGRADHRMVPCQIVKNETEVALDAAARTVSEQQRGSAAPDVDIEPVAVCLEKCLFRCHAQQAKLRH